MILPCSTSIRKVAKQLLAILLVPNALYAEGHEVNSQTWVGFPEAVCVQIIELKPHEKKTLVKSEKASGFANYTKNSATGTVLEGNIARLYFHYDGLVLALTGAQSDTVAKNFVSGFDLTGEVLDFRASFELRAKNGMFPTRVCLCNSPEKEIFWEKRDRENVRNGDVNANQELTAKRTKAEVCRGVVTGKLNWQTLKPD